MFNLNKISEFITTFCYIGKIKYCPGTFGSLAAFPLCYLVSYYWLKSQPVLQDSIVAQQMPIILTLLAINVGSCVLLFIMGTYFSSLYVRYKMKEDPKEVVIDEVVGQMLTIILITPSVFFVNYSQISAYLSSKLIYFIFLFLLPFSLFRFCDIMKPWPINWLDKNIKGGIGIMLDDVLAAIFAAVLHYAITFTLIDWFG